MMRRKFLIFLLVLTICTLSGCWDRNELEDLGVVTGLGIEQASQGKIRIIIQTLNTAAVSRTSGRGLEFEKAYRNSVAEGDTLVDAFDQLRKIISTKRFLSHTEVFIISEELARDRGMQDILDFMERDPQIRLDAWVIVGRGSLVNLMDVPGRISTSAAQRISNTLKFQDELSYFAPLKLAEFLRQLQSDSSQPYTAVMEIKPNASVPTDQGHGILDGTVPEPLNDIALSGTAVFRQDKLVGILDEQESQGLLWLRGQVKRGPLTFSVPGREGKSVTTSILKTKGTLQPEIKDGQVYITAKIEVETYLDDNQARISVDQPADFEAMEVAQGEEVKREVQAALQKAQQEYKVDVFGFGEAVHRKDPREWKQLKARWAEVFPDVQVDVQVTSRIQHTGLISNGPQPGQQ